MGIVEPLRTHIFGLTGVVSVGFVAEMREIRIEYRKGKPRVNTSVFYFQAFSKRIRGELHRTLLC